jgi:hypothetical protein
MERSYSDKYIAGSSDYDLYQNRNTEWVSGPGTMISYTSMVFLLWAFLHFSGWFSPNDCWTVVNVFNTVGTFIFLHWMKGNPDANSQGDYTSLTVFEQMEAGVPYTATKKFFMLVPAVLCWLSCYTSKYEPRDCVVNIGLFFVCIFPKLPEMHRVRIFGVNATTGIDDEIEFQKPSDKRKESSKKGK